MDSHVKKADEIYHCGHSCAQSTFSAFSEEIGMSEELAQKIACSFGGGIAQMREVCGALLGAYLAAGLLKGFDDHENESARNAHYAACRKMADIFKEKTGSIYCRDLLEKNERDKEEGTLDDLEKPCSRYVRLAAELMDRYANDDIQ